jgi:imidazoleglycerol phosphate synthase glutamine amidotransferase subunit HisH
MTSDEETTKTKIVDLEKLYNFVVENFFISIRLGFQTLISKSDEYNTKRKKSYLDTSKCQWSG